MYCACIWDKDEEKVTRFYWVSTLLRAHRLIALYNKYINRERYETFIETERSNYNLDHACYGN